MEAAAKHKFVNISPQKARLVANEVRGMSAEKAVTMLQFSTQKAAGIIKKIIDSAVANAEHNLGADIDELTVSTIFVDQGPTLKRFKARARGRGDRILKRTCHITVVVSDNNNTSH